jgi:cell fate (sporulation/competence/biofilm development) regulator YlbF (YheA/YmcA/DUF963 family)
MATTLSNNSTSSGRPKAVRSAPAIKSPVRPEIPLGDYVDRQPDNGYVVAFVEVRKKKVKDLAPAAQAICRAYQDEQVSIEQLMHQYHATYATIRTVLTTNGVQVRRFGRPKGKHWEGYDRARKITAEQRKWLLDEDLKGTKHRVIAARLGISRERVRQLCAVAGHKPRYERAAKSREAQAAIETSEQVVRAAQREQRLHTPTPQMLRVSELWMASPTLEIVEIANRLHLNPNSLGVQIARWRKRHPDLFPRRYRALRLANVPVAAGPVLAPARSEVTENPMQGWLR